MDRLEVERFEHLMGGVERGRYSRLRLYDVLESGSEMSLSPRAVSMCTRGSLQSYTGKKWGAGAGRGGFTGWVDIP